SLLQVAHYLIGPALGLKPPVTSDLADVPLDTAAHLLSLDPDLVREAHNGLLPHHRKCPKPMLRTPPTPPKIRRLQPCQRGGTPSGAYPSSYRESSKRTQAELCPDLAPIQKQAQASATLPRHTKTTANRL